MNKNWNLEPLLENKDLNYFKNKLTKIFSELKKLETKISESKKTYLKFLDLSNESSIITSKIFCYLNNLENTNLSDSKISNKVNEFSLFIHKWSIELSFIHNEILDNIETLLTYCTGDTEYLKIKHLRIARNKKHKLSNEEEKLLSKLGIIFGASEEIFTKLTNADFKFDRILDKNNKSHELTQGNAAFYIRNEDICLRKNAYFSFWKQYKNHENTLATNYYKNLCETSTFAQIYKYETSLTAALFSDNVDEKFYDMVLEQVAKHNYLILKWKKILARKTKNDNPKPWDWNTEIFTIKGKKYSPEDGKEIILKSLKPLGDDYAKKLNSAFNNDWIDWMPKENKRSGAYSYGVWGGNLYILLNWNGKYLDLSTLAHELGHSMHSLYSCQHQKYEYHNYPIFLAEVASTTNEILLVEHFLETSKDPQERAYVLENIIREMIATIFRQAQFADFEKAVHHKTDNNQPISLEDFKAIAKSSYSKYYPKLTTETYHDEFVDLWGLYVPHFYSDFYVYKYITGMICATIFSQRIKQGKDIPKYMNFLSSGSSKWPLDTLKEANIDLLDSKIYDEAFNLLEKYINELDKLV